MIREGVTGPGGVVCGGGEVVGHRETPVRSADRAARGRRSPVLELVGRFRVRELARVAGISVDELAKRVMRAAGVGALVLPKSPAKRTRMPALSGWEVAEPVLADLLGRATCAEVEAIADRWVLGRVLGEHRGNVTRAAAQLGVSRRQLRTRWAKVRELPATRSGLVGEAVEPAPPSLRELLERGASYGEIRAAVRRWLIEGTLARLGGNVTRAADVLGISRAALRRRRRRIGVVTEHGRPEGRIEAGDLVSDRNEVDTPRM